MIVGARQTAKRLSKGQVADDVERGEVTRSETVSALVKLECRTAIDDLLPRIEIRRLRASRAVLMKTLDQ